MRSVMFIEIWTSEDHTHTNTKDRLYNLNGIENPAKIISRIKIFPSEHSNLK